LQTWLLGKNCEKCDTATDMGIACCKAIGIRHECLGLCSKKSKSVSRSIFVGTCRESNERIRKCKLLNVPEQPGKPTIEGHGSNYCDLSWKIPSSDGGSKITKYIIEYMEKVTGIWEIGPTVSVTTVTTEYQKGTCTGLTEGKEYVFRCIAVNEVGPSLPSSSSGPIVTTATVPQYQKACCLEKGIPDICLGLCMGACIETPGEMAVSDNLCTEHQQAARECCKKEKGK